MTSESNQSNDLLMSFSTIQFEDLDMKNNFNKPSQFTRKR